MSTILETIKDQKHEEIARAYLESHFNCQCINMPQFSPVDCIMVKPDRIGAVEFKFRTVDYNHYPDIWLEDHKQTALIACKGVWDKAYFMPCFNGVLYMIEVADTLGCQTVYGGRYDRGLDDNDTMAAVPMSKLIKVGKIW